MDDRTLDEHMAEVLAAMPAGPMVERLATAIGALVRASGLPPEDAWCALAAIVSAAHGDTGACVRVALPVEGEPQCRLLVTCHANGAVQHEPAVVTGRLDDGAARPH